MLWWHALIHWTFGSSHQFSNLLNDHVIVLDIYVQLIMYYCYKCICVLLHGILFCGIFEMRIGNYVKWQMESDYLLEPFQVRLDIAHILSYIAHVWLFVTYVVNWLRQWSKATGTPCWIFSLLTLDRPSLSMSGKLVVGFTKPIFMVIFLKVTSDYYTGNRISIMSGLVDKLQPIFLSLPGNDSFS